MRLWVCVDGLDRAETELLRRLPARDIHPVVCGRVAAATGDALRAGGIPARDFTARHRLDFAAARRLRDALAMERPDILYAPQNTTLAVALRAARGTGIPVVAYRGTTGHLSWWDPASRWTYLHSRVAAIVCVSDAVRRYLAETMKLPPARLETIYKGHDPAWYTGEPPARADFDLAEDDFVVGLTARIRPVKGGMTLLAAARAATARIPRLRLLLAGELCDRRVERELRDPFWRGRVVRLGFRADAWRLARLADVFVMPSLEREGLPRAVIEAMAQGVPVVVSDAGGMPELVRDGVCGRVVPAGQPAPLAEALTELANDTPLRRRYGEAARARIARDFHVDETARRFADLLRRIAADVR